MAISAALFVVWIYCCVFLAVFIIDWRCHIIPNKIIYPSLAFTLILLGANSLSPEIELLNDLYSYPEPIILSGLMGGICGLVLSGILFYAAAPGKMGAGDVKLAGLIGLVVGFPIVFVALFIGTVCASMAALYSILRRGGNHDNVLPLGPFLAIGAIVTLLWGPDILAWGIGYWGY